MKRFFIVFAILIAALVPALSVQAAETHPYPSECVDGDVVVESHTWWTSVNGPLDPSHHGHSHIMLCWPLYRPVSGMVTMKVHSTMFQNPGTLDILQIGTKDSPHTGSEIFAKTRQPRSCPIEQCDFHDTLTWDSRTFKYDGWQLMRLRLKLMEPDGKENRVTLYLPIEVKNGKSVKHTADPKELRAQSWYTGNDADYLATRLYDFGDPKKSGDWYADVQTDKDAEYSEVLLDPKVHAGSRGTVIKEDEGRINGLVKVPAITPTGDTARDWHRLFIRSEKPVVSGSIKYSSVLVIWFKV